MKKRHKIRYKSIYIIMMPLFNLATFTSVFADQAEAERFFRQRCSACHSLTSGQARSAPHLVGVIGRSAGSVDDARYSAAMRDLGIVWDEATLDAFLAAPRQRVPGTTMTAGVPDPVQRAAIIAYLQSL